MIDFRYTGRTQQATRAAPNPSPGAWRTDFGVNPFARVARFRSAAGMRSRIYCRPSFVNRAKPMALTWVFRRDGQWVLNTVTPAFFHRADVYPEDRAYAEFQNSALLGNRP